MISAAVLVPLALRALKFLIAVPKLRTSFVSTLSGEGQDVSPDVVASLSGDAEAIRLLSDQIDEAIATNAGIVARLEAQVRAASTRLDS